MGPAQFDKRVKDGQFRTYKGPKEDYWRQWAEFNQILNRQMQDELSTVQRQQFSAKQSEYMEQLKRLQAQSDPAVPTGGYNRFAGGFQAADPKAVEAAQAAAQARQQQIREIESQKAAMGNVENFKISGGLQPINYDAALRELSLRTGGQFNEKFMNRYNDFTAQRAGYDQYRNFQASSATNPVEQQMMETMRRRHELSSGPQVQRGGVRSFDPWRKA